MLRESEISSFDDISVEIAESISNFSSYGEFSESLTHQYLEMVGSHYGYSHLHIKVFNNTTYALFQRLIFLIQ